MQLLGIAPHKKSLSVCLGLFLNVIRLIYEYFAQNFFKKYLDLGTVYIVGYRSCYKLLLHSLQKIRSSNPKTNTSIRHIFILQKKVDSLQSQTDEKINIAYSIQSAIHHFSKKNSANLANLLYNINNRI